jgi:hypothetical protein
LSRMSAIHNPQTMVHGAMDVICLLTAHRHSTGPFVTR